MLEELCARAATNAGGQLKVEPYREAGQLQGVDLGVDPNTLQAAEALCQAAFAVAAEQQLVVFDPQLGREVLPGDAVQIAAKVQQCQAASEATPLFPAASAGLGLTASGRLWLALGAGVVGLLLFTRALSCAVS